MWESIKFVPDDAQQTRDTGALAQLGAFARGKNNGTGKKIIGQAY